MYTMTDQPTVSNPGGDLTRIKTEHQFDHTLVKREPVDESLNSEHCEETVRNMNITLCIKKEPDSHGVENLETENTVPILNAVPISKTVSVKTEPQTDYGQFVEVKIEQIDADYGQVPTTMLTESPSNVINIKEEIDIGPTTYTHPLKGTTQFEEVTIKTGQSDTTAKTTEETETKEKPNEDPSYDTEFRCDICNKKCKSFVGMRQHKHLSHGELPVSCSVCEKKFKTEVQLRTHRDLTHDRVKKRSTKYQCHICDKYFSWSAVLLCHLRTHTGEKPFPCVECGNKFTSKQSLRSHMYLHTIKPQVCDVCGKRFKNSSELRRHQWVHKDRSERPFPCEKCGKHYVTTRELAQHLRRAKHEVE